MMNMNKEMLIGIAGGAILLTAAVAVGVRKIRKGKKIDDEFVGEVKEEEIVVGEEA